MKERIDIILVKKGKVTSRERARALIMEGHILVNGVPVTKSGALVDENAEIVLRGEDIPYVSRGGLKLEAALDCFKIDLEGLIVMDIGSSTGGFTDCMLQRGARKIYCIDVGYGQLSWPLRNDPRVILYERTNIRYLEREKIPDAVDLAAIDVSFISLKKVIPKVTEFVKDKGGIIALVKPQFEVGKGEVGRGGIIRDEGKRIEAVNNVREFAESIGLRTSGVFESPVAGQKGNREYFLYLRKD